MELVRTEGLMKLKAPVTDLSGFNALYNAVWRLDSTYLHSSSWPVAAVPPIFMVGCLVLVVIPATFVVSRMIISDKVDIHNVIRNKM